MVSQVLNGSTDAEAGSTSRHNHIGSSTGLRGSSIATRSTPDFLVLVLDCNLFGWASAANASKHSTATQQNGNGERHSNLDIGKGEGAAAELEKVLKDVLIFLNAHMALQYDNGVAVYAASGAKARLLFSSAPHSSSAASTALEDEEGPDANTFQEFKALDSRVYSGIKTLMQETAEEMEDGLLRDRGTRMDDGDRRDRRRSAMSSTGIVAALSQALCHVHRLSLFSYAVSAPGASATTLSMNSNPGGNARSSESTLSAFRSRILVLSVTPDASTQYVSMMNCIFGAQKAMVSINVCKLHGGDSVFLQQAAFLTHGSYLRVESRKGILQVLMSTFLASTSVSKMMNLPNEDEVDFRAACFCHRKIVDVGYVCSVCLSIFCEPLPACTTCKSRFPRRTLERFRSEHKLLEIIGVTPDRS
ncbi:transcription factor Tfb4 [Tilletiaria anomala UBC 951]|uniref:General transcription and DNA repair factor IIH subunit TFB4 n=1 Tax=Tilletiaria anomala (strain ATCC 24038 / CBS 436.72 / UBC 951) TaxID=1037660 RepID=A0A066VL96_TILAU|nr:transcription factor Tfb4 [Tilletiaria anomala UBC 951]KDN42507.1 transcription factor Tfb4 [Tilletiaria anomala UBC 951]